MSALMLRKPHKLADWLHVYRLYLSAFPVSERKPFSIIVNMYRKGKSDVWCIEKDGCFAGLAATINDEDLILLDYFAVNVNCRGKGIGTEAIRLLQRIYTGKGLFVEIESAYEDAANREERLHRKQFYLRCGMAQMNVMARVFGVKMELLGSNCRMDFNRYHTFYRDNYSSMAAKNILKEQHPEE